MKLDLNDTAHEAALRWACEKWDSCEYERDALRRQVYGGLDLSGEQCVAIRALSSPALAADLIRQLVERAGVKVRSSGVKKFGPPLKFEVASVAFADPLGGHNGLAFGVKKIPAIIARLLDLAPNAGAEAVLKALRGEA